VPKTVYALALLPLLALLSACGEQARLPAQAGTGADPALSQPNRTLVPTIDIAPAVGWTAGATPTPAAGMKVTAFAQGLDHPRWLYVLPNGDVLVAETNAPPGKSGIGGVKGAVMKQVMKRAGAGVPSANRITLLRDTDGDGKAEFRSVFLQDLVSPFGMVLVTGPTGSGKTTTLYSALSELNQTTVNITTAEDPVEYNLKGINQVQMHDEIGLNFAAALRSFLRQDPNIIMVGEIRDLETASIATKAALTGHLVLSTLHTNDAASSINRLIDMGIEPFLVASSCNMIIAQRLVRKLCDKCKQPITLHPETLQELGITDPPADLTLFEARGCVECNDTGYRGRRGLYEVMPISAAIREMIIDRRSAAELKQQAIKEGMATLRGDGLDKFKKGMTSLEEILRETSVF